MRQYATLVELHEDVANSKSVRELHAVLRAGLTPFVGEHRQNECDTCRGARDRLEEPAAQLHDRVEHDLSLQTPRSNLVIETLERLRTAAKSFAHEVIDSTPASREQSLALTSIETALQQAIAARVRNQD